MVASAKTKPPSLSTSRNGLLQIAQREAFAPVPYQDGDHLSWGFGVNNPDIKPTDRISLKDALADFKKAIAIRDAEINKALKVIVTQEWFDALSSVLYQGGNKKFRPLVALINSGDMESALAWFEDPKNATSQGGKFYEGLKARRLREKAIAESGDYGDLGWFWQYEGHPKENKRVRYEVKEEDLI